MSRIRPKMIKKIKRRPISRGPGRPVKARLRPFRRKGGAVLALANEERLTRDRGANGLDIDIAELKQREASFRLLFDSNPVPMIVCALDDERILGVNDAAAGHYGYSRGQFEKLTFRDLQAFDSEPPWAIDLSRDEQAAR